MIPLWLTITCSIFLLTVVVYNFITSDIDWKRTIKIYTEITIVIIASVCVFVIILSLCQWLSC